MQKGLPEALNIVVEQLSHLPGLGPKSAMRVAMALLKMQASQTKQFGQNIIDLRDKLQLCSRCESLTESDPCHICADLKRQKNILCLVGDWDSLLTLENVGVYKGQYLIISSYLPNGSKLNKEILDLDKLQDRLNEGEIEEVLFALGSTLEAEANSNFIRNFIQDRFPKIQISRLAQGMPIGAEVKYMDSETLKQSIKYRQI